MAHSSGTVKFNDDTIMYFEYNGTMDICIPKLYTTFEEMESNWRKWEWEEVECNHELEEVEINADYSIVVGWEGKACRKCNMIVEVIDPYEYEPFDEIIKNSK